MSMAGSVRLVCSMALVATLVSTAAAQKTERAATFAPYGLCLRARPSALPVVVIA